MGKGKISLLVGVTYSGKSVYAKQQNKSRWIDLTAFSMALVNKPWEQLQEEEKRFVFALLHKAIAYHLTSGTDILLEGRFLTAPSRLFFVNYAKKNLCEVDYIWFDPPLRTLLQRVSSVKEQKSLQMELQQFQMPTQEEKVRIFYYC